MESYKISKVLNNNVVIADSKGEDVILIGKAIGFNYRKGDVVPEDRVENTFVKGL
jgi:transcriptional antiterminator